MNVQVGDLEHAHWPAVRRIFAQGIDSGISTFETSPPDWESWDRAHLQRPRLVARAGDVVVGWAALSPVSSRHVYRGVAEVSVYVDETHRGRGVGSLLLTRLVRESEREGIWTLQAGVFPENEASVALHRKGGFRVVGIRERMGKLWGRWRDILLLERRSPEDEPGGPPS